MSKRNPLNNTVRLRASKSRVRCMQAGVRRAVYAGRRAGCDVRFHACGFACARAEARTGRCGASGTFVPRRILWFVPQPSYTSLYVIAQVITAQEYPFFDVLLASSLEYGRSGRYNYL